MKRRLTSSWQKRLPIVGTVHFARHPKAKRISIRVTPTGKIRVTVPCRVSRKTASSFALNHHDWILRAKSRARQRIVAHNRLPLNHRPFDNGQKAARFLINRLEQLANQFGYPYNRVTIRRQKTIWGSCSAKNNISLNIHLARLPDPLITYVILHELTHTRHKHHGNAFWSELKSVLPELDLLRRQLQQYHPQLFTIQIQSPKSIADFGT